MAFLEDNANIILRDGTSQDDRISTALSESFVLPDERGIEDLLFFIYNLASQINYTSPEYILDPSKENINWQIFFEKSPPFLLARISNLDIVSIEKQFQLLTNKIERDPLPEHLFVLLDEIVNQLIQVNSWYTQLPQDLSYKNELNRVIRSNLRFTYAQYLSLGNHAISLGYAFQIPDLNLVWDLNDDAGVELSFGGNQDTQVLSMLDLAKELIEVILKALRQLILAVPGNLDQAFTYTDAHEPHLGLLFAFLRIFQLLQEDFNKLGAEHLDFFYRRVLLLSEKEAVPDSAHLIFELAKQIKGSFKIDGGTVVKDGKDRNGADILFELIRTLIADQVKIGSLRTIYLDLEEIPVPGQVLEGQNPNTIRVKNVYSASTANSADGLGAAIETEGIPPSWKTLGSDNLRCTALPEAKFGFALASPVLSLSEGKRRILISFKTELPAEIINWGKYLNIKITIEDGWMALSPLPTVSTTEIEKEFCSEDYDEPIQGEGDGFLEFEFELESTDPAITPYQEDIHLKGLDTSFPVAYIELLKDKDSDRHAYDILRELKIEEIKIKVSVRDAYDLVISNENGPLDPSKAFMPFGAVPKIGSAFYIGSAEAFQKNLTQLCIKLKWDGLPVDKETYPHGFKSYYEGYYQESDSNSISTQSFEIDFQLLKNGVWLPAPDSQAVPLFGDAALPTANMTFGVSNIDLVGKIASPELQPYSPGTQNGFVRWILDPIDFKHREYPQILTRQNLALGKFPEEILAEAVYRKGESLAIVSKEQIGVIASIKDKIDSIYKLGPNKDTDEGKLILLLECLYEILDDKSSPFSLAQDITTILENLRDDENPNIAEYLNQIRNPIVEEIKRISDRDENVNCESLNSNQGDGVQRTEIACILREIEEIFNTADELGKFFSEEERPVEVIIPNPPYTPQISEIAIHYQAIASNKAGKKELQFFHIHPFEKTFEKIYDPYIDDTDSILAPAEFYLVPQFNDQGNLYIGLQGLKTPMELPLLLQFAEGTANPDIGKATVKWAYLDGNNWIEESPSREILRKPDETKGLIASGIVDLNIGPIQSTEHSILPRSMRWLRVSAPDKVESISELINIHPQAVRATFLDRGRIYLGIRDIQPGANVELNISLVNPEVIDKDQKLVDRWFYLNQNQWSELDEEVYLKEDFLNPTNELRQPGKLNLLIPKDATDQNSLLAPGFFWFRIDILQQSGVVQIPVSANNPAVNIRFSGKQNDFSRLTEPLNAGSITKLFEDNANIKSVKQPYPGFGGQIKESSSRFHIRVSEHLRHKGRAINLYDYERLILEHFPQIHRVKCIRHTLPYVGIETARYRDLSLAPGFVTIAVIPELKGKSFAQPLQPKADLSLLVEIEQFLRNRTPTFIRVCVLNPRYEAIRVRCDVQFTVGSSDLFYRNELEKEIRRFLAPWAFDEGADIMFGGEIFASTLIEFIERRSYVEFVKNFEFMSEPETTNECSDSQPGFNPLLASSDKIVATTVRSVLTSAQKHIINIKES